MSTNRNYPIEYGDRIYVRVLQGMDTILEVSVENVKDFTQLIGEVRYAGRELEGLSKLIIRNHSRGWSCERMIKFYSGTPSLRRQALREAMREAAATIPGNVAASSAPYPRRSNRRPSPRMPFPWETH